MFDCGINTLTNEISNNLIKQEENYIVKAVQETFIDIDKEKLEKCSYDSKSFYDDGYKEGYDKGYEDALFAILENLKLIMLHILPVLCLE